jgi:methionine synthase II (cobalamin-independent)
MRSFGRHLAKTTAKLVEHPELVADRIITFAEIAGPENVIAGTDCGVGGVMQLLEILRDNKVRRAGFSQDQLRAL